MYRIMIVEDDEVIAKVISEQLAAWGLEPIAITDFSDVMKQFSELSPQLVLMDISLPFFQRLPLVQRDTPRQPRARDIHILRFR